MARMNERVALVTGAASGIGRATALAFGHAGARVAVADLDGDGIANTLRALEQQGADAFAMRTDVSRAEDVVALFARIEERFGRLDFAFNNAGIEGRMAPADALEEADWDRVLAVNLKSVWLCLKEELRLMRPARRGSIICCSSVAGLVGVANAAAYAASKHGMIGLVRSTALDVAAEGVRVNAVCPGVIRTAMIDRYLASTGAREEQLLASEPVGRMGTPEEVASAVLWLSSDEAAFVTGIALPVDGGWVAR